MPPEDKLAVHFAPQPLIVVLGVKYLHLRMDDGTDLYITEYGLPFTKCLLPENHWCDVAWRDLHSIRLPGTSALYRMTTKAADGHAKEIVIKWNRMGQDIPGETAAGDLDGAEFNSPFTEFSLVLEMRDSRHTTAGELYTHKPLAIYSGGETGARGKGGQAPSRQCFSPGLAPSEARNLSPFSTHRLQFEYQRQRKRFHLITVPRQTREQTDEYIGNCTRGCIFCSGLSFLRCVRPCTAAFNEQFERRVVGRGLPFDRPRGD